MKSEIVFSDAPGEALHGLTAEYTNRKIAVIVDENTEKHCLPLVADALPEHWLLPIPSGETHKHLDTCQQLWQALTTLEFGRKDLVINLGGGVIGDMGGFVASTYKRGLPFINVPTTLLSQVDASVGGKLGVDFQGLKNHIGVFNDPEAVLISSEFLKTLPERELLSGYAEVLKHGLIRDAAYWKTCISTPLADKDWEDITRHSVAIKSQVVENDPYEGGERKILNFGHTLGHAIETFYLDTAGHYLHGEAVAAGMICESYLSRHFSGLSESSLEEITDYLAGIYPLREIEKKDFEEIIGLTLQDKKNERGTAQYSLLKEMGEGGYNYQVPTQLVLDSLFYFNKIVSQINRS